MKLFKVITYAFLLGVGFAGYAASKTEIICTATPASISMDESDFNALVQTRDSEGNVYGQQGSAEFKFTQFDMINDGEACAYGHTHAKKIAQYKKLFIGFAHDRSLTVSRGAQSCFRIFLGEAAEAGARSCPIPILNI